MPTQLSDAWEVKEWLQNAMQLDLDQHDWMKTLLQEFAALGANRESDIRGIPSWKIHNLKGIVPEPYRKKFDVAIQKKTKNMGGLQMKTLRPQRIEAVAAEEAAVAAAAAAAATAATAQTEAAEAVERKRRNGKTSRNHPAVSDHAAMGTLQQRRKRVSARDVAYQSLRVAHPSCRTSCSGSSMTPVSR